MGNLAEPGDSAGGLEGKIRDLEREMAQKGVNSLAYLTEQIRLLTGADEAAIAFRDMEGLSCYASNDHAPVIGSRLAPDSVITRACLATGRPILFSNARNDPRIPLSVAQTFQWRSVLAVPIRDPAEATTRGLKRSSGCLGLVEVFCRRAAAFHSEHTVLLQRLALLIALLVHDTTRVAPTQIVSDDLKSLELSHRLVELPKPSHHESDLEHHESDPGHYDPLQSAHRWVVVLGVLAVLLVFVKFVLFRDAYRSFARTPSIAELVTAPTGLGVKERPLRLSTASNPESEAGSSPIAPGP